MKLVSHYSERLSYENVKYVDFVSAQVRCSVQKNIFKFEVSQFTKFDLE